MRIFKKRILLIDQEANVGGIYTFESNIMKVFDKNDVVVDILTFAENISYNRNEMGNDIMSEFENMGVIESVHTDELKHFFKEHNKSSMKTLPFLARMNEDNKSIYAYVLFRRVLDMMQRNIYDAIFLNANHVYMVEALLYQFPFHRFINVMEYTHYPRVFIFDYDRESTSKHLNYGRGELIRSIPGKHYTLITQINPNNLIVKTPNMLQMGMPLDVESIHEYSATEREDKVLFLGRFHTLTKNPDMWCQVMKKTGLGGIAIVPNEKEASKFRKLINEYDIDVEVHHSLAYDEKMKQIARCKCYFTPSNSELFPFTVYETIGLMPVVAADYPWAHNVKEVFPHMVVGNTNVNDLAKLVQEAVQNFSMDAVNQQYEFIRNYRDSVVKQWGEYLQNLKIPQKETRKPVGYVERLEKCHTLPEALKMTGRDYIGLDELIVIYRNLDYSKLIQTKYQTYYGEIPHTESEAKADNSLEKFFK